MMPKRINLVTAVAKCQTISHKIADPKESTSIQLNVQIPIKIQAIPVSIQKNIANPAISLSVYSHKSRAMFFNCNKY